MRKAIAINMFEAAKTYCEEYCQDELEWAISVSPDTFKNLKSKQFLYHSCQVVYHSGLKRQQLRRTFPELKIAFKNFDLEILPRIRSINPVLAVFNNETKAKSFREVVR